MQNKKRPQYIKKQLAEINDILHAIRLKDNKKYDCELFMWFTQHLLHHGWYRGFNYYIDEERDGKTYRVLAGPEFNKMDYYIQIW